MSPDHHHFIAQIAARQLGQYVIRVAAVGIVIFRSHAHPQLHWNMMLDHAGDHIVVLRTQRNGRDRVGALIPAGHEHRAMFATAGFEDHARA